MNSAQISFRTRRRWLWFFAALFPALLLAVLLKTNSWRPRIIGFERKGYVDQIFWLQEGQQLLITLDGTNDKNGTNAQFWDVEGRQQLQVSYPPTQFIDEHFLPSADGKELLCLITNHLWKVETGTVHALKDFKPCRFVGSQFIGYRLGRSVDKVFLEIIVWDANSMRPIRRAKVEIPNRYKMHLDYKTEPYTIAFSPDGATGVVAIQYTASTPDPMSPSHLALTFNTRTGRIIKIVPTKHNVTPYYIEWTEDNDSFILLELQKDIFYATQYDLSSRGTVTTRDLTSGLTLVEPRNWDFSSHGDLLAIEQDEKIEIWNTRTKKLQRTLPGRHQLFTALAFSPDEQTLAVGEDNGTVSLWRLK